MTEPDDLERWVNAQKSDGVTDSEEQSFTIDHGRAWAKLGAFQLPKKEYWILLLVQAAVEAGCTRIEVTQSRKTSSFRFLDSPWTEESVQEALLKYEASLERGLARLSAGLRALAVGTDHPFQLHYPSGRTETWNGEELVARSSGAPGPFQIVVTHLSRFERDPIGFKLARIRAEIAKTLTSRCFCSPVPIVCDGLSVTEFFHDPHCGLATAIPLVCLRLDPVDTLPDLPTQENNSKFVARLYGLFLDHDTTWEVTDTFKEDSASGGECGAVAIIAVPKQLSDADKLEMCLVKSGVIIVRKSFVLRSQLAVTILVSGDGLQTDLSGFEPRETALVRERCRLALEKLIATLEQESDDTLKMRHTPVYVYPKKAVGKYLLGYAGFGTLLAGPAGLILFSLHGLAMAGMALGACKLSEVKKRWVGRFPVPELIDQLKKVRIAPDPLPKTVQQRQIHARAWEQKKWRGR